MNIFIAGIPGGVDAKITERPYQVRLLPHGCGGIIINPNWILTAAHCVDSHGRCPGGGINILAGTTRLSVDNFDEGYQIRYVSPDSIHLYPHLEGRLDLCSGGAGGNLYSKNITLDYFIG